MIARRTTLAGIGAAALAPPGLAQGEYPGGQTVSIVIPYAAGGSPDVLANVLIQGLTRRLGGTFVMDHKPGASTTLAARQVARARPDGSSLLLGTVVTFTMAPFTMRSLGYDPVADFAHVTLIANTLFVMVANPRWPSLDALVAEAKRRPGALTYASWGVGTSAHLLMVDFCARTGIEMLHVPFNGAPPALTETLAGRVDVMFSTMAPAKPHVESGRLKPFGLPAAERSAALPAVPTMIELGYADFIASGWFTISAPARTPEPILARLEPAIIESFADPDARRLLDSMGLVAAPPGAAALRAQIERDMAINRELLRRAGIQPE